MNTEHLANDLLAVTSRLIALMEKENALLRAMRPQDIRSLQDDKQALAAAYQALMQELAKSPADFNGLTPALRAEIEEATTSFRKHAGENMRAINSAREVNARVIKAVVDAVNAEEKKNKGYSRSGQIVSGGEHALAPPLTPLSVNKSL